MRTRVESAAAAPAAPAASAAAPAALPRSIVEVYPLSPAQQGVLFHSLAAPTAGSYCVQMHCTLLGPLDAARLQRAWEAAVATHAVLRTDFDWEEFSEPVQVVNEAVDVPFAFEDAAAAQPPAAVEARLAALLLADRGRPFDLTAAPLMRLRLLRTGELEHHLIWTYHHLLLDGWSALIVLRQVLDACRAEGAGDLTPWASGAPFSDYVRWLRGQDQAAAELAWRQALAGFAAPTPLPAGRPENGAAPTPASRGDLDLAAASPFAAVALRLPPATTTALREVVRRQRLSLNTVMQAAWALLLSRASGHQDVVFGTAISTRPAALPGAETMVGLLVNTVPVRVRLRAPERLGAWLSRLQAEQLALLVHQHAPLARLQEWSGLPRGVPLFASLMLFENHPVPAALAAPAAPPAIGALEVFSPTHYPLTLTVVPGQELSLELAYDRRCFDAPGVRGLLSQMAAFFAAAAAGLTARVGELPSLPEADRRQVLVTWNDTLMPPPAGGCLIHQSLEMRAAAAPDAVAVRARESCLTYGELNRAANRLARELQVRGVQRGEAVAVCMERSPELLVALLAVAKAGAAYLPLDPAYPPERLGLMLASARAAAVVTSSGLLSSPLGPTRTTIYLDRERQRLASRRSDDLRLRLDGADLAYAIFTSGSTGVPKAVLVPHRAVTNLLAALGAVAFGPADRLLAVTTICFDIAALELFLPLLRGGQVVLAPRETAADGRLLAGLLASSGATAMQATPTTWEMLFLAAWSGLSGLTALCGGEELARSLASRLAAGCAAVFNLYGPTETTIWSLLARVGRQDSGPVPIGGPLANTRAYVLDAHLQPVPAGVAGALYLAGEGLARGYLDRPDRTAERFLPDAWSRRPGERVYATGDLARWSAAGGLEFLGRTDSQVKVRGFRVEPGEVEAALRDHPQVAEAAVRAATGAAPAEGAGGARLLAWFVPRPGSQPSTSELGRFLRARLPEFMVPAAFIAVAALPRTANGKLDRGALPLPGSERPELADRLVAPRNAREAALAAIWEEVLGLDRIGVHDNFFELGGDSIRSLLVAVRAARAGWSLTPDQIFARPTIAALVEASPETSAASATAATSATSATSATAPTLAPSGARVPMRSAAAAAPLAASPGEGVEEDVYPLSPMQHGMLFHSLLAPGSSVYLEEVVCELRGPLLPAAFHAAWESVVARHPVLRSAFSWRDPAVPVQVVHRRVELPWRYEDWRGLAAPKERLAGAVAEERRLDFDPARAPLLRHRLIRVGDESYRWIFCFHHALLDGWSLALVAQEAFAAYSCLAAGLEPSLPALAPYRAYVEWLGAQDSEQAASFWRRRLAGFTAANAIDLGRPRRQVTQDDEPWGEVSLRLAPAAGESLAAAARRHALTLNTLLQGAWSILIGRYSGSPDVVFGATSSGRPAALAGVEAMVGLFVNTLPMRVMIEPLAAVLPWLAEVQRDAAEARRFEATSLIDIQAASEVPRGLPLFETIEVLESYPQAPQAIAAEARPGGIEVRQLELHEQTHYPLSLVATPGDEVGLRLIHDRRRFDRPTCSRLLGHLANLLSGMAAADPGRIIDLPWLSAPEIHQLVVEAGGAAASAPAEGTVLDRFAAQAARTPAALAVAAPDGFLTYGEVWRRAGELAARLRRLGARPGERVALCLERSAALVVAMVAVQETGAAYLPLDTAAPATRLRSILDDAQALAVVVAAEPGPAVLAALGGVAALSAFEGPSAGDRSAAGADRGSGADRAAGVVAVVRMPVATAGGAAVVSPRAAADSVETARKASRPAPHDVAYLIATSGSTGRPKLVAIAHGALLNLALWHQAAYDVRSADRGSMVANPAFDAAQWEVWPYLICGASLHVVPPAVALSPAALPAWLAAERISLCFLPTPLAEAALALPWPTAARPRAFLVGGDRLHRAPSGAAPAAVFNHYGPTEVTVVSTVASVPAAPAPGLDGIAAPPPIGRPIAGLRAYVLDSALAPVAAGLPGELALAGVGLAYGYFAAPALTAAAFVPDPFGPPGERLYRTGDRVRRLPDGQLEFLGRLDRQLKLRGVRIEPAEIEAALGAHPAVAQSAVLLREDRPGDRRLVAYVVGRPGSAAAVAAMAAAATAAGTLARADPSSADGDRNSEGDGDRNREEDGGEGQQVERWRSLYDETYEAGAAADPAFDLTGWRSSYSGEPIPPLEMAEWVERAVERIGGLMPRLGDCRVLEIGCGTGLLLFRLAPQCRAYHGLDFSPVALERLRRQLGRPGSRLPQVTLLQRRADELADLGAGGFDLVILNSVIQYFPSLGYLERVLAGALAVASPDAAIFLGDVRSLPLLGAFHASVELARAAPAMPLAELRRRQLSGMAGEEELLIDPGFFHHFARRQRRACAAEVLIKRGHAHNEMTRFRYDAVLRVGAAGPRPLPPAPQCRLAWEAGSLRLTGLAGLAQRLRAEPAGAFSVTGIPDGRVQLDLAADAALAADANAGAADIAGELAARLPRLAAPGVDPEELWALGEELGYTVALRVAVDGPPGTLDAEFAPADAATVTVAPAKAAACDAAAADDAAPADEVAAADDAAPADEVAADEAAAARGAVPARAQANQPLAARRARHLSQELRALLAARLPETMLPADLVLLAALPLTARGKIDYRALPPPDLGGRPPAQAAPRTALEARIAAVWEEVLGLRAIGTQEGFFELGGHSLLAVQLMTRLRAALGVDLPLASLFEAPTVAGLAALVTAVQGAPAAAGAGREAPRHAARPAAGRSTTANRPFGLTAVQRSYWRAREAQGSTGGTGGANVYAELEGDLGEAAPSPRLDAAVGRLIARHEMLRVEILDAGRQRLVSAPGPFRSRLVDLRHLPPRQADACLAASRARLLAAVRPAGQWPLFELTVFRLAGRPSRLLLVMDAMVADGTARDLLLEELLHLLDEPAVALAPLAATYREFAADEKRRLRSAGWRRAMAGFRRDLAALPPPPPLAVAAAPTAANTTTAGAGATGPTSTTAGTEATGATSTTAGTGAAGATSTTAATGAIATAAATATDATTVAARGAAVAPIAETYVRLLPATAWARLRRRAGLAQLTPSAVVLAAFVEALSEVCAAESFLLGLAISRRPAPPSPLAAVVGNFSDVVLLAVEPVAGGREQRAKWLQERVAVGLEQQNLSGLERVEELAARLPDRFGPDLPVLFNSLLASGETTGAAALPPRRFQRRETGAYLPGALLVPSIAQEFDGTLACRWQARVSALLPGVSERLLGRFAAILAGW